MTGIQRHAVTHIINLDAGVQITASDGEARIIKAGEVILVEDTSSKGHLSKAVEGKIRNCIFVARWTLSCRPSENPGPPPVAPSRRKPGTLSPEPRMFSRLFAGEQAACDALYVGVCV